VGLDLQARRKVNNLSLFDDFPMVRPSPKSWS